MSYEHGLALNPARYSIDPSWNIAFQFLCAVWLLLMTQTELAVAEKVIKSEFIKIFALDNHLEREIFIVRERDVIVFQNDDNVSFVYMTY